MQINKLMPGGVVARSPGGQTYHRVEEHFMDHTVVSVMRQKEDWKHIKGFEGKGCEN